MVINENKPSEFFNKKVCAYKNNFNSIANTLHAHKKYHRLGFFTFLYCASVFC